VATVSLVVGFAHSPYLFASPDLWPALRAQISGGTPLRADLPRESPAEREAKHGRCRAAFAHLAKSLAAARPQALILIGDDQRELFQRTIVPFAIYTGARVAGFKYSRRLRVLTGDDGGVEAPGQPALARALVEGLARRDFDVACFDAAETGDTRLGHAFTPPLRYLTPDGDVAVVPLLVSCYEPPAPSPARCYAFGRALRAVLAEVRDVERVAVACSGGLWHTPGHAEATIDEAFDHRVLDALAAGRGAELTALPEDVLVSGTGEVRNWIVGAGLTGTTPWTVVDYVPVYSSPIGAGFAECVPA
jgi:hypothetical protein